MGDRAWTFIEQEAYFDELLSDFQATVEWLLRGVDWGTGVDALLLLQLWPVQVYFVLHSHLPVDGM